MKGIGRQNGIVDWVPDFDLPMVYEKSKVYDETLKGAGWKISHSKCMTSYRKGFCD